MGQDREVVTVRIKRLPIREDKVVEHIISKRNYSTKDIDVVYTFKKEEDKGLSVYKEMLEHQYQRYLIREPSLRTYDSYPLLGQSNRVSHSYAIPFQI